MAGTESASSQPNKAPVQTYSTMYLAYLVYAVGGGVVCWWLFGGGGKTYTSTPATIAKVVVVLILSSMLVAGVLVLLNGNKRDVQTIGAKYGRKLTGRLNFIPK